MGRCAFIKENGEACSAFHTKGSPYCYRHDPDNREVSLIASRKGGQNRRLQDKYGAGVNIRSASDVRVFLGEVTLRGRVLEIGGLKEKSIAGHRAGLTTIICQKDNKKDLDEIQSAVKKDIKFVSAEEVKDVLKVVLTKWPVKMNLKYDYISVSESLVAN